MRLIYFSGSGNFGDELNEVLWPKLAVEAFSTTDRVGFLGIGTIIGMPTPECDFVHVFSSGVGYDRLIGWNLPRRIWCVRGPLTAHMIGADADAAITDGAVLAPWVIAGPGPAAGPAAVGVMPHWESLQFPGWQQACDLAGYRLLNPIGDPASVVQTLRGMSLVLTESLHGAIIADSYGIPWVPIRTSRNFSVFKWMDWCLSMQVDLVAITVPPPSVDALLRFGRPVRRRWGERIRFSADDAIDEFDHRVGVTPATNGPPECAARGRARLRMALERSATLRGALGRIAGCHPVRTAAHLVRAAQADPMLSRAALREQRRDQMAERFGELCRIAAQQAVT